MNAFQFGASQNLHFFILIYKSSNHPSTMQIVASSVAMGSAPVCAMAKPRCSIAAPRKGPFGTHFAAKPLKAIRTLEAKAMNGALLHF